MSELLAEKRDQIIQFILNNDDVDEGCTLSYIAHSCGLKLSPCKLLLSELTEEGLVQVMKVRTLHTKLGEEIDLEFPTLMYQLSGSALSVLDKTMNDVWKKVS